MESSVTLRQKDNESNIQLKKASNSEEQKISGDSLGIAKKTDTSKEKEVDFMIK